MKNTPESEIRERIDTRGRICFAEFMEIALYHPQGGYYTGPPVVGAEGDYFTSPAAHPVFGALIAVQLYRMWQELDHPSLFDAVEMGAGDGLLARDVVEYAPSLGTKFAGALRYTCIDRRTPKRAASSGAGRQHQVVSQDVPVRGVVGCLITNELVDAFPVHRFQVEAGAVKELFVTLDESNELGETLDEPCTPMLKKRLAALDLELPDGFSGEVNLAIGTWMRRMSDALERGFVVTIDYGYPAKVLYNSDRSTGTLKTYYRHAEGGNPYVHIGRQDMTAHVDFSLIASEGQAMGLRPLALMPQSEFLKRLGFRAMLEGLRSMRLTRRELSANTMAMLELVKPEGLGGFGVLIQERGTGVDSDAQLALDPAAAIDLPVPLQGPEHTPLMEGRYPHVAMDMDELWPTGNR